MVKLVDEVANAPFVVTVILPVVAVSGTVTMSCVADAEVTLAFVPLNFTVLFSAVTSKPVPVIVTEVPATPEEGSMDVIASVTVKLLVEVAVAPLTVTVIFPVAAPAGTVVVMDEVVDAVTTASVPLNLTVLLDGVVLKDDPLIVTVEPIAPDSGEKPDMPSDGVWSSFLHAIVRKFRRTKTVSAFNPCNLIVRIIAEFFLPKFLLIE
jgi:hypothetical protein